MPTTNGTAAAARPRAELLFIPARELAPWEGLNPRRTFPADAHREMVASVKQRGVIEPLIVHDAGEPPRMTAVLGGEWVRYRIIAGERRWRAAMAVDPYLPIPCMVGEYDEAAALEIALVENMDRHNLTAIEEARGFQRLLDAGWKQKQLVSRFARSQAYVSNRIRLLQLPDEILALVETGKLQASVARDALLPFMAVPETYRAPFFARVAEELALDVDLDDPYGDDAEDVIRSIARDMTRSLNPQEWGNAAPAFSPKRHEKGCDCGAPELKVLGDARRGRRCWNLAWWDAEQKRAKADKKKREQRQPKITTEESLGDLPVMESQAFHRKFGHAFSYGSEQPKYGVVANYRGEFDNGGAFDPDALDASTFLAVKSSFYGGAEPQYELVTTDAAALQRAREAFAAALKERIQREQAPRVAKDLEVARAPSDWHDPAIVVRTLLSVPQRQTLNGLARELGYKPKGDGWDGQLKGLTAEQMMDVVHVMVLRCANHGLGRVWLVRDLIQEELEAPLREKLRALVPWPLPAAGDAPDQDELEEDEGEAACIVCECTESFACEGGCSWLAVNRETGRGVCSSCAESKEAAEALLAQAVAA